MARANNQQAQKTVNPDLTARALAKCVADGDIVNFRLVFAPFSPARAVSTVVTAPANLPYWAS